MYFIIILLITCLFVMQICFTLLVLTYILLNYCITYIYIYIPNILLLYIGNLFVISKRRFKLENFFKLVCHFLFFVHTCIQNFLNSKDLFDLISLP